MCFKLLGWVWLGSERGLRKDQTCHIYLAPFPNKDSVYLVHFTLFKCRSFKSVVFNSAAESCKTSASSVPPLAHRMFLNIL